MTSSKEPKKKLIKIQDEIEEFRKAMEPPTSFEDGFNWISLLGAIFVGLVMVPGAVYMSLLAGEAIGPAARWVTVILFIEVARRAQRNLKNAEIFVLFYMVGAAMAMPFGGLLWTQFFARSEAAIAYGIAGQIPYWYAPSPESESYIQRTFLHKDWIPAIGLVIFYTFFGRLNAMILGYGFFRMASDIEGLPFPMAPVGAQGIIALAEDVDEKKAEDAEKSWRWRVFSIGGALGLTFGAIYLLLPTLTGAFLDAPIKIIPIPFVEFSHKTSKFLPAVATGINLNLLHFVTGMVLPFWAMMGKAFGLLFTFAFNPILYHFEILKSWIPGDDTISTVFKNRIDFYFSFSIGISIAIFFGGIGKVVQSWRKVKTVSEETQRRVLTKEYLKDRGDIPQWLVISFYFVFTFSYIFLSGFLIDWHPGVMVVLCFFGFVYTPMISYVTARLEGIAGMVVEIPMLREACLILSGYHGVAVWFLPIPKANFGDNEVIFYRQCELTGTKFRSIWKTQVILTPMIIVSSILYMSYIWGLAEVPSSVYPFAQRMWELRAATACIMFSSTLGEYSIFEDALRWSYIFAGAGTGVVLFGALTWIGFPIFFCYGAVQGLNETIPHSTVMQFCGALVGRFYFRNRLGLKWRQYVPVVAAGFSCGMGLIASVGIGISFLAKAVIKLPF